MAAITAADSSTGIRSIAADDIDKTFSGSIGACSRYESLEDKASNPPWSAVDLISKPLGSRILALSDEWFAAAENLTTPTPPVRKPGVFTHAGAWYDGWETRRHNTEPADWVIIRLGVASGKVGGVEIDTAFFNGNHAPEVGVDGCFNDDDDAAVLDKAFDKWETILPKQECGPSARHAWQFPLTPKPYTHVRLLMYPDGGIARFRLYGHVLPILPPLSATGPEGIFDLAATVNGGVAVSCSDQHFGRRENLLLPGRGVDMGDGWETARSRGKGHMDWVIVRLGAAGEISKIVVDTAHFRGNFPQTVRVEAIDRPAQDEKSRIPSADEAGWTTIIPSLKCGPDKEHEVDASALENVKGTSYTHVKLVIIPDGGVKRFRVFGRRSPARA
ncbi:MAG: hypothetical protein M1819_000473 [Sarea resinae]|nr:MAG: hypothetical protein M1819_000473 [Sarea resinae]